MREFRIPIEVLQHSLSQVAERHPKAVLVRNAVGNLAILLPNEDGTQFPMIGYIDLTNGEVCLDE